MRAGAIDFIKKMTEPGVLLVCVDRALRSAAALRVASLNRCQREVMAPVADPHLAPQLRLRHDDYRSARSIVRVITAVV